MYSLYELLFSLLWLWSDIWQMSLREEGLGLFQVSKGSNLSWGKVTWLITCHPYSRNTERWGMLVNQPSPFPFLQARTHSIGCCHSHSVEAFPLQVNSLKTSSQTYLRCLLGNSSQVDNEDKLSHNYTVQNDLHKWVHALFRTLYN